MKSTQPKMTIHRLCFQMLLPVMATGFSLAAQAEALEPDYSLTYNVGVLSDYRVRGIAQTSFKPALQGGIDYANKNGLYIGTALSNVRWVKEFNGATKGSYELDLYGGHKGEIAPSLTYDVGVISYRYPGNDSGVGSDAIPAGTYTNASTTEIYGALTYRIYTLKYNRSVGDFLGNPSSSGSQYFDLSAAYDLGNGFSLSPHIGRQLIPNQPLPLSYTDVALTLSKDFGNGFVATAAALANNAEKLSYTDINNRVLSQSVLTVGVKYSF